MAKYPCKKIPYDLTLSHNTSITDNRRTDAEQTDRRQTCHKLDRYLSTVG